MHIRAYLAALEFVNEERAARGLAPLDRLPEGLPGIAADCVIARALPGSRVGANTFDDRATDTRKVLPREVSRFVRAFDGESMPFRTCDPATLVDGGIDDEKGALVPA